MQKKEYCQTPQSTQAKDGMLVIYTSRSQTDLFKATNEYFVDNKCGSGDKDLQIAQAQNRSADYDAAGKEFASGKFQEAGDDFYAIDKLSPVDYPNCAEALFNAALAYEKAGKPKTAMYLYSNFVDSKDPAFTGSKYFIEALFRTADSKREAFDYQGAVDDFRRVVDEASVPGRTSRPEFDLTQAKLDAMWNAAYLRDLDCVYYDRAANDPGAATLYLRYSKADTKNKARASQAAFFAALVYEKAGSTNDMITAFANWKKTFGGDLTIPNTGLWLVTAQYKTAKALEKSRDKQGATQYYTETIKAFDASGEKPGSAASELAAESQFWLAEQYYKDHFEPYSVVWGSGISSQNAQKQQAAVQTALDSLKKISTDTAAAYLAVARFNASWSLAAIVRVGDIYFYAGQKIQDAPVPPAIIALDKQYPDQNILGQYQDQITDLVTPQTQTASTYWIKALDTSKAAGVSTAWSKLALEHLNAYVDADKYPAPP